MSQESDAGFEQWWWHIGSGMRPEPGEDGEEHLHRVSEYVWDFAHRQGQRKAQYRIQQLESEVRDYTAARDAHDRLLADYQAAQDRIRLLEEALAFTRKYFDKPACEVDHGYTDYVVKWIDSLLEESK